MPLFITLLIQYQHFAVKITIFYKTLLILGQN